MTWIKSTTTKHTCGGPSFGRKTPGCPRCDELIAGAAPIVQAWRKAPVTPTRHTGPCHRCLAGQCGPICVVGDW